MPDDLVSTRRSFVNRGLTLLSAAATVPTFLERTAQAFADEPGATPRRAKAGRRDHRVLVVLQLAGGNDGLNTIVPYRADPYYRARPQIAVPRSDALKLTDELGLNPAATGLKQLYDDGLLAIVQGAGYPNPDRSHFRGTEIWETADPAGRNHRGWLGRYFDCECSGRAACDPKLAIALTQEAPLTLEGESFSPVAFSSPAQLTWQPGRVSAHARAAHAALLESTESSPATLTTLDYVRRTALDAQLSAHEIQDAAGGSGGPRVPRLPRQGGAGLAQQLSMVARMIAAGLPTRVYYVALGGFDTHAQQAGRHTQLLRELGDGLTGFVAELRRTGQLDRVLVMSFSEFGRRVEQNASQGTDHGAAAPMFLVGSRVAAGLIGVHPPLDRLDNGDLRWGIDFRSVYQAVLADWLGANARRILGGSVPAVSVLRKR
ncbi:MAG: DUF1501 domain-containing protein [Phycisphaerae bacterium]